jgi:hypothetical protein
MNEKDNYLKTAELSAEQNYNQIDGILNNAPPLPPEDKPLDRVKRPTEKKRNQELER